MKVKSLIYSLAIGGTLAIAPSMFSSFSSAQAALLTTNVECDAAVFDPMYLLCAGAFEGNVVPNSDEALDIFADLSSSLGFSGTWSFDEANKSDSADNGVFTSNPETTLGTLTFKTAQFGLFGISLKAADSFSLYLFDGGTEGITSINFETIGTSTNRQGKAQDLSHAGFFAFTPDDDPIQVPEPAATAALGLFALTGMGLLKKKSGASA